MTENILAFFPLFKNLDEGLTLKLSQNAPKVVFHKGSTIMQEGEKSNGKAYILLNGIVSLYKNNEYIKDIARGELIGEMALLSNEPRNATIKAAADALLLEISEESLMRILGDEGSDFSKQIVKRVEENISRK